MHVFLATIAIRILIVRVKAFGSLSNPEPPVQLPRLKGLYEDLRIALTPLLPTNHLVLVTFSSPLSPTSSPLRSVILHLSEAIAALRERCAPVHDTLLDSLKEKLASVSSNASTADLARLIVDVVKSILELADLMKDDLSQFVLGSMSEKQLRGMIISEAKGSERRLILELWSVPNIQASWDAWMADFRHDMFPSSESSRRAWILRLLQGLSSTTPVSCPLPTVQANSSDQSTENFSQPHPGNTLPPPFFFTCQALIYIQNYLQALVITASLRSLVRLPVKPNHAAPPSSAPPDSSPSFMERIWTLLKTEIDTEANDIKIINLADEVVQVHKQFHSEPSGAVAVSEEEGRLRAAVDRTLHAAGPVFQLLQKRLLQALAARLQSSVPRSHPVSVRLQAGRERPDKRPRLAFPMEPTTDSADLLEETPESPLLVKGFEDAVLVRATGEIVQKLKLCIQWMEMIWPDLIDGRTLVEGGPRGSSSSEL